MITRLAWRNVWRNKTRSLAVILALSTGLFGAIFYAGIANGMVDKWIKSAIDIELSDIQIHNREYLTMEELGLTIDESKIDKYLENDTNVKSFATRLKTDGMAMTANNSHQVMLYGIDPDAEKNVSTVSESIIEGNYFDSLSRSKPVLISQRLADKLKVRMKSKIIFTIADINGDIAYENFKVHGIFKTNNSVFDLANVYVMKSDLSSILKINHNQCHEIAIRINENTQLESTSDSLNVAFPEYSSQTWKEISPTLSVTGSTMMMFNYVLIAIVLVALLFGIVNTMLMVILERTKEIGMLRALGMHKRKIALMITMETIFLCLVGAVFGNILSFGFIEWFEVQGLHFEEYAEGFEQYGMSASVYPTLEPIFYLNITLMVAFTSVFSSIFPIIRAFKLNPASAIRD